MAGHHYSDDWDSFGRTPGSLWPRHNPGARGQDRAGYPLGGGFPLAGRTLQHTPSNLSSDSDSSATHSAGSSCASSRASSGRTTDNLLIFDWDDTLLCTGAINRGLWSWDQLRQLELITEATLREAMCLGETIIVTNGNATWVEDSARMYMPGLLPLLRRIKVISARAIFEAEHPGNPFSWKRRAFQEITSAWHRYRSLSTSNSFGGWVPESRTASVNLTVVGDAAYEIEAAESLKSFLTAGSTIKTIKMIETPCILSLMGELRRVKEDIHLVVDAFASKNVNLQRLNGMFNLSEADNWKIVDRRNWTSVTASSSSKLAVQQKSDILPTGIFNWLLCREPGWLGEYEEAYPTSNRDKADRSYLGEGPPLRSPWQH